MSDPRDAEERDWTAPPRCDDPKTLWEALHDASIREIASDRLAREVRIELELGFPQPPGPCPERVVLLLAGVTHALVYAYWPWSGPWPMPTIPLTPEMRAAVDQYNRNSRVETASLDVLQRWIEDETDLDVMAAHLHQTSEGVSLVIDGTTDNPETASGWQVRVGAESLDVVQLNGSPLGLDELLRLGNLGWETWSNRPKDPSAAES